MTKRPGRPGGSGAKRAATRAWRRGHTPSPPTGRAIFPETNRAIAVEAIERHLCVQFTYAGYDRIVEVHAVGINASGQTALSGYQVGGKSQSGQLPGWRLFLLGKCAGMKVSGYKALAPRADYRRDSALFRTIIAAY
ncbi:hypothetical protein [Sphingomonas sp. C3-2]|uniref:hypothetical protein n=1 Tax=Sphingomonas sp. C3-2 TaxID=3062169 RepID=UPI00294B417A|nr:hypothetical protein [Sphingomonas sp. C3-2]WOK37877.1 hypothetical protein QYC26_06745 [Sphingomonas sp. C3-2]